MGVFTTKTLKDLVTGLRASKRDTSLYISSCIAEIKTELSSTDPFTKANALQKLTFLQMMGYDMSWASFSVVEVMSSPRFAHKRIGYLAASQGFNQHTEVILLTTNLLKKELRGAHTGSMCNIYSAGLAINCLSNIVTEELARELLPDLNNLVRHPHPYIRKKSVMCLFKLFVKYPQGLRLTFDQIRKCLDDPEPEVVSCAVNVITELSDKNPRNYLHLAPALFNLLTTSSNNWMLIKVVKLLGSLVAEEPRLARKLLEPLSMIVKNTKAKSLLYESVYTITLALPHCKKQDGSMPANIPDIVTLCANTLLTFVEDQDQNLKYLGLVGFNSLTISHPKILASAGKHRDLLLRCLSDEDVTIRTRALELLAGMATRKNLKELIGQLLHHVDLAEGSYKLDLVGKIVYICSMEKYSLITDFHWYLATLVRLAYTRGIEDRSYGELLKTQVMDVALRVLPVRRFAVAKMARILLDQKKIRTDESDAVGVAKQILFAAAWVVGEYSALVSEACEEGELVLDGSGVNGTPYYDILEALLDPISVLKLDFPTQAVYLQSSLKVFASACKSTTVTERELSDCVYILNEYLPFFSDSSDKEVQERAFSLHKILISFGLTGEKEENQLDRMTKASESMNEEKDKEDPSGTKNDAISDLLQMTMGVGATSVVSNTTDMDKKSPLSQRCRLAANSLSYLLTPDPMKPVSAKSQKKKCQNPVNATPVSDDILNYNILTMFSFSAVLQGEKEFGKYAISVEDVDFTQQRNLKKQSPVSFTTPQESLENDFSQLDFSVDSPMKNAKTELSSSFQPNSNSQQQQQLFSPRTQDPFYLNSGTDINAKQRKVKNQFEMIQLGGYDDEEDSTHDTSKRSKKKSKKLKKQRKEKRDKGDNLKLGDTDFGLFSNNKGDHVSSNTTLPKTSILDSDDDSDDGSKDLFNPSGKMHKRPDEFTGLARVDLTEPLRHDEVMPVTTHRQVPPPAEQQKSKKKKKDKKKKNSSKKESTKQSKENKSRKSSQGSSNDLLGLGDGGFSSSTTKPTSVATTSNAINSAFTDDLLGLTSSDAASQQQQKMNIMEVKNEEQQQQSQSQSSSLLEPVNNLNQDNIAEVLTSGNWQNVSSKVEFSSLKSSKVISKIAAELNLGEVEGNKSKVGTLVGRSTSSGVILMILVKVKSSSASDGISCTAKIDIKCQDKDLSQKVLSVLRNLS